MAATLQESWLAWVYSTVLLSARLSATLLMTPVLQFASIPAAARILLLLGLSGVLAPSLSGHSPAIPSGLLGLFAAMLYEVALGATLAVGILLAFSAFSIAGRLLDVQAGFGMGQVYDPLTRTQIPVVTSAFNHVAILVFFLAGGHHALLRGIAISLDRFPLGRSWSPQSAFDGILLQAGGMLGLGFALAAPVVICLLLIELALGVIGRNLPQMNMLVMGIPVKVVATLVLLSLWFLAAGDVMAKVYSSIFEGWAVIFASSGSGGR